LFKLFDGQEREALVGDLKTLFSDVRVTRPDATRKSSFEIYIICKGYKNG